MSVAWKTTRLKDIADIRVSNVDKKSFVSELPVNLCNYMDVYANDYVVAGMPFMSATATQAEIAKFRLRRGDVMITKDSETPDDIGIPSVLVDDVDNLLCGYHLALIRPKADEVCSVYLAKQLAASPAARYFGLNASGSTRFGIPVGAIENFELPLPELREQSKIAEVLSTVDRAIAQTEAWIAKQERIKAGLMQDLLTRGIDERGQLRSETTHAMVPLSELAEVNPPRQRVSISGAAPVSFVPMSDVSESGRWNTRQARPYSQVMNGYTRFLDGDVLFAKITPCMENGKGCHAIGLINGLGFASTEFHVLRAKDDSDARFIFQWTLDRKLRQKAAAKMTGSAGQQRVPASFFDTFLVPHFTKSEQEKIAEVLTDADEMIEQGQSELTKLRHVKTALMQDLLTGNVRVTPLLQQAEEAATA